MDQNKRVKKFKDLINPIRVFSEKNKNLKSIWPEINELKLQALTIVYTFFFPSLLLYLKVKEI
jgi:hypothetical protein